MADMFHSSRTSTVLTGSTSKSFFIEIVTSVGAPATGLAFGTVGLIASYAGTKLARVAITPADLAAITTAWSSGGFKEVDATNMPGVYRIDVPDAALALAVPEVNVVIWKGSTFHGSLTIPLATITDATIEAKVDTANTSIGAGLGAAVSDLAGDVGEPLTGTLAQTVEALGVGIITFDANNSANTTRQDN
jgi:hypothetical protein